MNYLLAIRPVNLLIVYLTQLVCYYTHFTPYRGTIKYHWNLYPPKIFLFGFVTVLIAASGYLINDYFDYDSDQTNRKNARIPRKQYLLYYFLLVGIGFALAMGIAINLGRPLLSLIYLAAVAMLYMYSRSWKKKVLIGNLVVSLFSAGVILILLYAEYDHLTSGASNLKSSIKESLLIFSVFAFLVSMVREIIKDIEDIAGDIHAGYNTLPIAQGVPRAGLTAAFYGFTLLVTLGIWSWHLQSTHPFWLLIFMLCFVILPICYVIFILLSRKKLQPALLSKVCKGTMMTGLILLVLTRLHWLF